MGWCCLFATQGVCEIDASGVIWWMTRRLNGILRQEMSEVVRTVGIVEKRGGNAFGNRVSLRFNPVGIVERGSRLVWKKRQIGIKGI